MFDESCYFRVVLEFLFQKLVHFNWRKLNLFVELSHGKDSLCTEKQLSLSSLACLRQHNTEIICALLGTMKGSVATVLEYVSHKILISVTRASSQTNMMMGLE